MSSSNMKCTCGLINTNTAFNANTAELEDMTYRLTRTDQESQIKRVKNYWDKNGKIQKAITMSNFYRPKGTMCINCKNHKRDCSLLDFKSMPALSTEIINGNFEITVKCTEYLKND